MDRQKLRELLQLNDEQQLITNVAAGYPFTEESNH